MAKGIRINKVNLGRNIQKQKRSKAKHKKKNVAAHKEFLKKAQMQTEQEGTSTTAPHLTRFRSTRQKKIAKKMTQRRERSKSQMDVTSDSTAKTTAKPKTTKTTGEKEDTKKPEEVEDNDDDEMMCD